VNAPRKIALFGGTFDPIHEGHLFIAKQAIEQEKLDEVVFLPCRTSPHKQGLPSSSAADRLAMIQLAIADQPSISVNDYDLITPAPSYSYLTVAYFRNLWPDAQLFWIMGCDQWNALPRWRNPELLAKSVTFLVFARGDAPRVQEGYQMRALSGAHPASASTIRDQSSKHFIDPAWLSPRVLDYCIQQHLYT
jgi:nicotinate-nucleotide adenylyltransferase